MFKQKRKNPIKPKLPWEVTESIALMTWEHQQQVCCQSKFSQQCHINTRSMICKCRHLEFLPYNSTEMTQVCQNQIHWHFQRYCKRIKPPQEGITWWMDIQKVVRGIYGLPQAGSLGHDLLEERLNKEGHFQSKIISWLWKHKERPPHFTLVVDDLGLSISRLWSLNWHFKQYYIVTMDLEGKEYIKIHLDWDYEKGFVHLSMSTYLKKALWQFSHILPTK